MTEKVTLRIPIETLAWLDARIALKRSQGIHWDRTREILACIAARQIETAPKHIRDALEQKARARLETPTQLELVEPGGEHGNA